MVHYFSSDKPKMSIYSGRIANCYPKLPGGCRTNVEMKVNEVDDVRDLIIGGHQVICYSDNSGMLKTFCKLTGIEAVA